MSIIQKVAHLSMEAAAVCMPAIKHQPDCALNQGAIWLRDDSGKKTSRFDGYTAHNALVGTTAAS